MIPLRLLFALSLFISLASCDCCSCDTQISQIQAVVYPTIEWNTLPLATVPVGPACSKLDCEYYQQFTCGVHSSGIHFDAVNCTIAQEKGYFPICFGKILINAGCGTNWDCCSTLNHKAIDYFKSAWAGTNVRWNYFMLYYSDYNMLDPSSLITCSEYSYMNPGGNSQNCGQFVEYYASSNWSTCLQLEQNFQANAADDFAFRLF